MNGSKRENAGIVNIKGTTKKKKQVIKNVCCNAGKTQPGVEKLTSLKLLEDKVSECEK